MRRIVRIARVGATAAGMFAFWVVSGCDNPLHANKDVKPVTVGTVTVYDDGKNLRLERPEDAPPDLATHTLDKDATPGGLVKFHTAHKLTLMVHSPS